MKPLLSWAGTVGGVWAALWWTDDAHQTDHDMATLLAVAAALTVLVTIMLARTRHWTAFGLGLLGFLLGAIGLAGRPALAYFGWMRPLTDWEFDLVRALWIVSTPLLVIGVWRRLRARPNGQV